MYMQFFKRLFDLILTTLGLIMLSPMLIGIGLIVRWKLGTPILFRQRRPGLHGKPFTIYKFRTMNNAVDEKGNLLSDEQRLTSLGKFLRSTSLDELPELINVLKGDMSLVGPRPLLMQYLDLYTIEQMRRHDVRPGITGWAQVNGRNTPTWNERLNLDLFYLQYCSFWLDIKILCLTLKIIVTREGLSEVPNGVLRGTMPSSKIE